jgi:CHAT domain-containing protein
MRKRVLTSSSEKPILQMVLLTVLVALTGCQSMDHEKMSLDEAKKVAVSFQRPQKPIPPRKLGPYLNALAMLYAEEDPEGEMKTDYLGGFRNDIVRLHYLFERHRSYELQNSKYLFQSQSTSSDFDRKLDAIAANKDATNIPGHFYTMAENVYFMGNTSLALRLIDEAIKYVPSNYTVTYTWCYATKARFLAEAGDFINAKAIFFKAIEQHRKINFQWLRTNDLNYEEIRIWLGWHMARTRASIAFANGEMLTSEKFFRQTLAEIENAKKEASDVLGMLSAFGGGKWREADARIGLSRALLWQGRFVEAEAWGREALFVADKAIQPKCLINLSNIFLEQGRPEDAREVAMVALKNIHKLGFPADAAVRAEAREAIAKTLLAKEEWSLVLGEYERIKNEIKADPETYRRRFHGSLSYSMALLRSGNTNKAVNQLEFALNWARTYFDEDSYNVSEIRALKAVALSATGQKDAALSIYNTVIPILLKKKNESDGTSVSQIAQTARFRYIIESYLDLITADDRSVDTEQIFRLIGILESHEVTKSMSDSIARGAVGNGELAQLVRLRQDLEIQLISQKNRLSTILQASDVFHNDKAQEEITHQIDKLEKALKTMDREVQDKFPRYSAITAPPAVSIQKIRSKMQPNEAFICLYSADQFVLGFAFRKDGPISFRKNPWPRKDLASSVFELRCQLNPDNVLTLGDMPKFDVSLAYAIFVKTLKPLSSGWKDTPHLIIVANGPFGQLPFSLFPTKKIEPPADGKVLFSQYRSVPWLIREATISRLPSIASLYINRSYLKKDHGHKIFIGFGDPVFNRTQDKWQRAQVTIADRAKSNHFLHLRGIRITASGSLDNNAIESCQIESLNRLPDTAEEIKSIAAMLNADPVNDVYIGRRASEEQVKSIDLSNRRIIAFATHALLPGDLDGLNQPAIALSSPSVVGGNEDGLLTMAEIMWLNLNADLVLLSACNTGAAGGKGAEALSGLGKAFFYAGARSLLVSMWPVESNSTKQLTTGLFQCLHDDPSLTHMEALRQSMLKLMDGPGLRDKNDRSLASYAHPIFWAPFIIVGE